MPTLRTPPPNPEIKKMLYRLNSLDHPRRSLDTDDRIKIVNVSGLPNEPAILLPESEGENPPVKPPRARLDFEALKDSAFALPPAKKTDPPDARSTEDAEPPAPMETETIDQSKDPPTDPLPRQDEDSGNTDSFWDDPDRYPAEFFGQLSDEELARLTSDYINRLDTPRQEALAAGLVERNLTDSIPGHVIDRLGAGALVALAPILKPAQVNRLSAGMNGRFTEAVMARLSGIAIAGLDQPHRDALTTRVIEGWVPEKVHALRVSDLPQATITSLAPEFFDGLDPYQSYCLLRSRHARLLPQQFYDNLAPAAIGRINAVDDSVVMDRILDSLMRRWGGKQIPCFNFMLLTEAQFNGLTDEIYSKLGGCWINSLIIPEPKRGIFRRVTAALSRNKAPPPAGPRFTPRLIAALSPLNISYLKPEFTCEIPPDIINTQWTREQVVELRLNHITDAQFAAFTRLTLERLAPKLPPQLANLLTTGDDGRFTDEVAAGLPPKTIAELDPPHTLDLKTAALEKWNTEQVQSVDVENLAPETIATLGAKFYTQLDSDQVNRLLWSSNAEHLPDLFYDTLPPANILALVIPQEGSAKARLIRSFNTTWNADQRESFDPSMTADAERIRLFAEFTQEGLRAIASVTPHEPTASPEATNESPKARPRLRRRATEPATTTTPEPRAKHIKSSTPSRDKKGRADKELRTRIGKMRGKLAETHADAETPGHLAHEPASHPDKTGGVTPDSPRARDRSKSVPTAYPVEFRIGETTLLKPDPSVTSRTGLLVEASCGTLTYENSAMEMSPLQATDFPAHGAALAVHPFRQSSLHLNQASTFGANHPLIRI